MKGKQIKHKTHHNFNNLILIQWKGTTHLFTSQSNFSNSVFENELVQRTLLNSPWKALWPKVLLPRLSREAPTRA